jgi:hypothetical protein
MAAGAFDFLRGLLGWWHGQTGTPDAPVADDPNALQWSCLAQGQLHWTAPVPSDLPPLEWSELTATTMHWTAA